MSTTEIPTAPVPELREKVVAACQQVYDPEIPVNIFELGLIYEIDVDPSGEVHIKMTLTSPMCPEAQTLPMTVGSKVECIPEVTNCKVEIVWDPPWTMDKMTEAARLQLGM